MADLTTVWIPLAGEGDWILSGPSLAEGDDLSTALLISLFSDRIAAADDVIPDGTGDPRGWWADADRPIGSRLWLLERAKQTPATLERVKDAMREALAWLVDDGVAARVDIFAEYTVRGRLDARVEVVKQDGSVSTHLFDNLWREGL